MADLYATAIADRPETLGGVQGDTPAPHPNVLSHMLKSLTPGQDLTRVTIPPWFLEPRSLLERWADVLMHPELLHGVFALPTPEERILAVARWFLSGWHYKTVGAKKPFNPIVGETFACFWPHEDGSRTQFFSEQVLHRPPISCVYFENTAHHFKANAHIWTKGSFVFPQSSRSALDGGCVLTLTNLDEDYWISFPAFYAHNLLLGSLRMEVGDMGHIVCKKTGLRVEITFQQMGVFSSSSAINSLEGRVFGEAGGKKVATFKGHWDKQVLLRMEGSGEEKVWLDITALPVAPKHVLPEESQGPWESRRLWQHTKDVLCTRPTVEWATVEREKGQLEEEQRVLKCHEKEASPDYTPWIPKCFKPVKMMDPVTGKERNMHVFTGEEGVNVLELSRSLPDIRGGLNGAGAVSEVKAATRSIKLSQKRVDDWEKGQ